MIFGFLLFWLVFCVGKEKNEIKILKMEIKENERK